MERNTGAVASVKVGLLCADPEREALFEFERRLSMEVKRVFEITAEVLVLMVIYTEKRSEVDHRLALRIEKEIDVCPVRQNLLGVHAEFT